MATNLHCKPINAAGRQIRSARVTFDRELRKAVRRIDEQTKNMLVNCSNKPLDFF